VLRAGALLINFSTSARWSWMTRWLSRFLDLTPQRTLPQTAKNTGILFRSPCALSWWPAAATRKTICSRLWQEECGNPYPPGRPRVFEVDHPATQEWKRELLASAKISVPETLAFAPVDFERQTLTDGLARVGFDFAQPAFFSWLGVTPYLTLEAFRSTILFIASLPAGTGVTFEYALPREAQGERGKLAFALIASRVEKAGEPFQLFFLPEQMGNELRDAGFGKIEELSSTEINALYFAERKDGLRLYGEAARLITAWI
jgi:hypothetical protein